MTTTDDPILKKLEAIENLPTLPLVLEKLLEAVNDPNSNAARVARIIEDDPSMMARILKVVNSAFYSAAGHSINALQPAVVRLGMRAVSNIALSTSVFSVFRQEGDSTFDREGFWKHSISTGIAMALLYEWCKPHLAQRYSRDILHLVGLLHDMGKIVLDQYFHREFAKALQVCREQEITLFAAENEVIGSNHAEIGSWLGKRWNLSREVLQAVRWHHAPEAADREHRELVMLTHCANYICNNQAIGDSGDGPAPELKPVAWKKLGLSVKDVSAVVDRVSAEAEQSEVLLAFA